MIKDAISFLLPASSIFDGWGAAAQDHSRLLKVEPEEFSEGFEPSEAFLERWRQTAPKRRLAGRLEKMRIDAGKTQAEIAEALDLDPTYVSKMESPVGPVPKADLVARFADACGYDTAYAFIRRGNQAAGKAAVQLHGLLPQGDADVVVMAQAATVDTGTDTDASKSVADTVAPGTHTLGESSE